MKLVPLLLLLLMTLATAGELVKIRRIPEFTYIIELDGEIVASREVIISAPQVWNAKLDHILPEGTVVKSGEVLLGINAQYHVDWMKQLSGEVRSMNLDIKKTSLQDSLNYSKKEFDLSERETGLRVQDLNLKLTRQGTDTREIEKMEIERQVLSRQIDFSKARLQKEKKLFDKGFISKLQLAELDTNLCNTNIDLKILDSDLSYYKALPLSFELFKAESEFDKYARNFDQEKLELSFLAKNQKVQLSSRKMRITRWNMRLQSVLDTLSKCVIKAPAEGIYMHPASTWWGGELSVGARVGYGMELGKIINPAESLVKCKVLETDIEKFRTGETAFIQTKNGTVTGEVIYISKLATQLYPGVKAYELKIAPHSRLQVIPNQKVRVGIAVASFESVYRIPADYLREKEEKDCIILENGESLELEEEKILLRDFNYVFYKDPELKQELRVSLELE